MNFDQFTDSLIKDLRKLAQQSKDLDEETTVVTDAAAYALELLKRDQVILIEILNATGNFIGKASAIIPEEVKEAFEETASVACAYEELAEKYEDIPLDSPLWEILPIEPSKITIVNAHFDQLHKRERSEYDH